MKILILAGLLVTGTAWAQVTMIQPTENGGYIVQPLPGRTQYGEVPEAPPPVGIQRTDGGGFVVIQPEARQPDPSTYVGHIQGPIQNHDGASSEDN